MDRKWNRSDLISSIRKMIIPIRCVSCNNVLAGKWLPYLKKVEEYRKGDKTTGMVYLTQTTTKTAEGKALDELGVDRMCCRRHLLTHVDL
jgi:DNA-directed RNA polymerase subunit N (RpoN/RPB10)